VMVLRRAIERKSKIKIELANNQSKNENVLELQQRLIERLSFSLTEGQKEAVNEINVDMSSNVPMSRLLQGDVGCGKTLVSFLAALHAVQDKGQAAIMAPTELL
ncbi:DEAD/DEAH box helicase, partial [Treponema sp. R6D11]